MPSWLTSLPKSRHMRREVLNSRPLRLIWLLPLTIVSVLGLASCEPGSMTTSKTFLALLFGDTIHFTSDYTIKRSRPVIRGLFGVLIDGKMDGGCLNDHIPPPVDSDQDMNIGFFDGLNATIPTVINVDTHCISGAKDEIIAFTTGHPPTISDVIWTSDQDLVDLKFQKPYKLPMHVWLVSGDLGAQRINALLAGLSTTEIWHRERQGFVIESYPIDDAPDNNLTDFDCSKATEIVHNRRQANAINIYYVDRVINPNDQYLDTQGIHCGAAGFPAYKDVVVVGSGTSPALLAHELGHAFGLGHVKVYPELSSSFNIMHEESNLRRYLTEGQTFRALTHPESAIQDSNIYKTYLMTPQNIALPDSRLCFPLRGLPGDVNYFDNRAEYEMNARKCPLLQTRIWPDRKPLDFVHSVSGVWFYYYGS